MTEASWGGVQLLSPWDSGAPRLPTSPRQRSSTRTTSLGPASPDFHSLTSVCPGPPPPLILNLGVPVLQSFGSPRPGTPPYTVGWELSRGPGRAVSPAATCHSVPAAHRIPGGGCPRSTPVRLCALPASPSRGSSAPPRAPLLLGQRPPADRVAWGEDLTHEKAFQGHGAE